MPRWDLYRERKREQKCVQCASALPSRRFVRCEKCRKVAAAAEKLRRCLPSQHEMDEQSARVEAALLETGQAGRVYPE